MKTRHQMTLTCVRRVLIGSVAVMILALVGCEANVAPATPAATWAHQRASLTHSTYLAGGDFH
jgi:hypothetical protein